MFEFKRGLLYVNQVCPSIRDILADNRAACGQMGRLPNKYKHCMDVSGVDMVRLGKRQDRHDTFVVRIPLEYFVIGAKHWAILIVITACCILSYGTTFYSILFQSGNDSSLLIWRSATKYVGCWHKQNFELRTAANMTTPASLVAVGRNRSGPC